MGDGSELLIEQSAAHGWDALASSSALKGAALGSAFMAMHRGPAKRAQSVHHRTLRAAAIADGRRAPEL